MKNQLLKGSGLAVGACHKGMEKCIDSVDLTHCCSGHSVNMEEMGYFLLH